MWYGKQFVWPVCFVFGMRSVSPLYYLSRSILSPGINALVLYHLCFVSSPSAELRIGVCHQLNRITFPRNLSLAHLPNFQTLTPLMQPLTTHVNEWSKHDPKERKIHTVWAIWDTWFSTSVSHHFPKLPKKTFAGFDGKIGISKKH